LRSQSRPFAAHLQILPVDSSRLFRLCAREERHCIRKIFEIRIWTRIHQTSFPLIEFAKPFSAANFPC